MTTILKRVGATLVLAATALVLFRLSFTPYRCNIKKKAIQQRTVMALGSPDLARASIQARRHLAEMASCLEQTPQDVDLYMIAAANYRLLNRQEEAIKMYENALKYDRRPEIYLQLGLTQLTAGKRAEAFHSLVTASEFDVYNIDRIPDPALRDQVYQAVNPTPVQPLRTDG